MVATVGAAFLGLTVNCARCHDHKFDPIPQKDYYRITALLAGVRHGERSLSPGNDQEQGGLKTLQTQRLLEGKIADLDALARAVVLKNQGLNPPPRIAVNPRFNVETFAPVRARFVRMTILATRDGAQPCLEELEIFGPDTADNLALASRGSKASASSLLPGYPIHQIAHLNDGRFGNDQSWISNEPGKGWAQIELPRVEQINRVVWSRDSAEDPPRYLDRVPTRYRIEVSEDGKQWQTVSTGDDRAVARRPFRSGACSKR